MDRVENGRDVLYVTFISNIVFDPFRLLYSTRFLITPFSLSKTIKICLILK